MSKRKRKRKMVDSKQDETTDKTPTPVNPQAAAAAYQAQAQATPVADDLCSDDDPVEVMVEEALGGMVTLAELREAEKQRDEYLDIARRAQADLENYRRRVVKEASSRRRELLTEFMRECIPALSDLTRVITEGEKSQEYQSLHDGVKMTRENLWKVMEKLGVVEIDAVGKPFDPRMHEALSMIPSPAHTSNTVIEVFQPGYMYEDFVISPARVVVAQ